MSIRFDVINSAAQDGELSAGAFRLLFVMSSRFINRQTGEAWPSLRTLGEALRLEDRQIRRQLRELSTRGYLLWKRGGAGRPNRYSLASPNQTEMSELDGVRPVRNVHSDDNQTGQKCPVNESDRSNMSAVTGQKCPPNLIEEPYREEIRPNTATLISFPEPSKKREEPDNGFDSFWAIYPRKDSKGRARPAFALALKKAPLKTILDGAKRYAAERVGKDAQYTKLPATWLNGECWSDQTLGMAESALQNAYADSSGWTREKFVDVIALAKQAGAWFPAYGDPANIPSDLIDAELQTMLDRLRTTSQIVA